MDSSLQRKVGFYFPEQSWNLVSEARFGSNLRSNVRLQSPSNLQIKLGLLSPKQGGLLVFRRKVGFLSPEQSWILVSYKDWVLVSKTTVSEARLDSSLQNKVGLLFRSKVGLLSPW